MIVRTLSAALIALAIAVAYWLGRESGQPAPVEPEPESAQTAEQASGTTKQPSSVLATRSSPQPSPSSQAAALPPADVPVVEYFDELARHAHRGDARSACRLGAELARCQNHARESAYSRTISSAVTRNPVTEVDDSMIEAIVAAEEKANRLDRQCAGLEPAQLARAFEFQRIAAERGGIRERLWYATAPALDRERFLDDLPEWGHYRTVAYDYLEQALAAGDPAAPAALAQVHLPPEAGMRGLHGSALRIPDKQRYLVYRELGYLLFPRPTDVRYGGTNVISTESLDASVEEGVDMEPVRAEADALRQRHYAGFAPGPGMRVGGSRMGPFVAAEPARICGD